VTPADRVWLIERVRAATRSRRELGTCDATDPTDCRYCEEQEGEEQRLLLDALDEAEATLTTAQETLRKIAENAESWLRVIAAVARAAAGGDETA